MRTCPQCRYENPDENGYCEQCHTLLPAEEVELEGEPGTYHPYVMWQGWPWAPNRTVMQSKDEFAISLVAGAAAIAVSAAAIAIALGIVLGVGIGALAGVSSGALGVAYLYFLWKSGRELALGYAGANP